jgi:hypothetical protein
MPGDDQCFDIRNLPAATLDSSGVLHTLGFDLLKGPALAIENGLFARVFLISLDNTIRVFRIDLYQPRFAVAPFARDQGGSRAAEQVCNDIPAFAAVQHGTLD